MIEQDVIEKMRSLYKRFPLKSIRVEEEPLRVIVRYKEERVSAEIMSDMTEEIARILNKQSYEIIQTRMR